jgi:hypothetical protein
MQFANQLLINSNIEIYLNSGKQNSANNGPVVFHTVSLPSWTSKDRKFLSE